VIFRPGALWWSMFDEYCINVYRQTR
jgi:hypothetical protein